MTYYYVVTDSNTPVGKKLATTALLVEICRNWTSRYGSGRKILLAAVQR